MMSRARSGVLDETSQERKTVSQSGEIGGIDVDEYKKRVSAFHLLSVSVAVYSVFNTRTWQFNITKILREVDVVRIVQQTTGVLRSKRCSRR